MLNKSKKILYIAPIPPPINGQSKANDVLLKSLLKNNEVEVINLSKVGLKNGFISFHRIFQIFQIYIKIWVNRKEKDIIYLSVSESILGNIRDLFIYSIFHKNLNKFYIHMLGGAGMNVILSKNNLLKKINLFFLQRINGVIVEGEVNHKLFSNYVLEEKIHIVQNFAEDFLFLNDSEILDKFYNLKNIQILYLSNLITGKGYDELLDAFFCLDDQLKKKLNLVFVGGFENLNLKQSFLNKIEKYNNINYIGEFIDGIPKRILFSKSHIFCLPTYYPYEGQPISILEAYATGCAVVTTNHSGIPYIFSHMKNGYQVEKKSVESIVDAITYLVENKSKLMEMAIFNRNFAISKFRTEIFQNKIKGIFKCK
jgi:glycosyltransferase involved in cell wall biosynthesis